MNADVKATITLNEGSENTISAPAGYAALAVAWESDSEFADLTIDGKGTLTANAGSDSAAIGGSKNENAVYGNITIKDGNIIADARNSGGAAIGSSATNARSDKPAAQTWGTITIDGGTIEATGNGGQSAGIGGGSHVDSGEIVINGGNITATGYSGIGSGLGGSKWNGSDPGPGGVFATVEINGGTITARGSDIGAGIGGAMYCDAIVTINGGTVYAYSGPGRNNTTHGGAAIGAGYQGHAEVTINGGEVYAYAAEGCAAPGIGSGTAANNSSLHTNDGRSGDVKVEKTIVTITGGTVHAEGGGYGGAGIGTGCGADKAEVNISGGSVTAAGGKSTEADKTGGSGIGSAYAGAPADGFKPDGEHSEKKHLVMTGVTVSITGGTVNAVGGWGASAIGSGAENITAETIVIDAEEADVEAYSDGTKFAVDTRSINDGSEEKDRIVTGDLMQGTFVFPYTSEDGVYQDTEGLETIKLMNGAGDRSAVELTGMPSGYRSFARTVPADGDYSVYTDSDQIAGGAGRYFNKCTDDTRTEEDVRTGGDIAERNIEFPVTGSSLSDNFYLFPVRTIVVEKEVSADDSFRGSIDTTLWFALWDDAAGAFVRNEDGDIWMESIEVSGGTPQGKAIFAGIDEGTYDVREIDPDDPEADITGTSIASDESIKLVEIRTSRGETEDDVTVVNYYEQDTDGPTPADGGDDTEKADPKDAAANGGTTSIAPAETPKSAGNARTSDSVDLALIISVFIAAGALAALAARRRKTMR